MRAVVITDNQGIALEVINTSMGDEEMAEYALGLVEQILEQKTIFLNIKPVLEQMLEELEKYSMSVLKKVILILFVHNFILNFPRQSQFQGMNLWIRW